MRTMRIAAGAQGTRRPKTSHLGNTSVSHTALKRAAERNTQQPAYATVARRKPLACNSKCYFAPVLQLFASACGVGASSKGCGDEGRMKRPLTDACLRACVATRLLVFWRHCVTHSLSLSLPFRLCGWHSMRPCSCLPSLCVCLPMSRPIHSRRLSRCQSIHTSIHIAVCARFHAPSLCMFLCALLGVLVDFASAARCSERKLPLVTAWALPLWSPCPLRASILSTLGQRVSPPHRTPRLEAFPTAKRKKECEKAGRLIKSLPHNEG